MCGITGYIGTLNASSSSSNDCIVSLINGLKRLQNRGYDSAGVCTIRNNVFVIDKDVSDNNVSGIDKIKLSLKQHTSATVGIGHTRWATHGGKIKANAHPHSDMYNNFCLVHNGIIENYQRLKDMLRANGFEFKSQTDTEVVVNLISYEYRKLGCVSSKVEYAILNAINQLTGTYALSILCTDTPFNIYCIRRGSPLLFTDCEIDKHIVIASEQSAFDSTVNKFYVLNEDVLCTFTSQYDPTVVGVDAGEVVIFSCMNITSTFVNNEDAMKLVSMQNNKNSDIGLYKHWTLKEIHEQPESCARALNYGKRLTNTSVIFEEFDKCVPALTKIRNLIILGCGTSYNAGMISTHYFKDMCNFNTVQVFDGAEFELTDLPRGSESQTACLLVSQSGETRDLIRCIELIRLHRSDVMLIGVVNVVDSMIARDADCVVYLNAGKEVAVASTKSFTSQLVVLMQLSIWFAQVHNCNYRKRLRYINELIQLESRILETLEIAIDKCDDIVKLFTFPSCFVLGKGIEEGISKEAALKIKEIAYIHAEGYSSSALKHGPFALLQDRFPVLVIALDNEHYETSLNAMEELKSRCAKPIFITNKPANQLNNSQFEGVDIIQLPEATEYTGHILSIIPLQLLAYNLAIQNKLNPDFPRNLAKVVTVS